jgi:hypothetical protein
MQFYNFLMNRVMITFRPKDKVQSEDDPEVLLVFSKKQDYDSVSVANSACGLLQTHTHERSRQSSGTTSSRNLIDCILPRRMPTAPPKLVWQWYRI